MNVGFCEGEYHEGVALKEPPLPLFWSTTGRYASYWNAFLSDRILTTKAFHYKTCTLAVNKGIVGVGNILHFKGENWFCPCTLPSWN